jgi:hypothetical protein
LIVYCRDRDGDRLFIAERGTEIDCLLQKEGQRLIVYCRERDGDGLFIAERGMEMDCLLQKEGWI